MMVILFS